VDDPHRPQAVHLAVGSTQWTYGCKPVHSLAPVTSVYPTRGPAPISDVPLFPDTRTAPLAGAPLAGQLTRNPTAPRSVALASVTMRQRGLVGAPVGDALSLGRHPSEVERGRRYVADACRDYEGDVAGTAMLLASELITNALRHGSGDITVLVTLGPDVVRVDVADGSASELRPRVAVFDAEHGRGLFIVDHLASAWGVEPLPRGRGKSVWFTLRAAPVR
jgi:hypothetical protein